MWVEPWTVNSKWKSGDILRSQKNLLSRAKKLISSEISNEVLIKLSYSYSNYEVFSIGNVSFNHCK